jgi:hypothetical protein
MEEPLFGTITIITFTYSGTTGVQVVPPLPNGIMSHQIDVESFLHVCAKKRRETDCCLVSAWTVLREA